MSSRRTVAFLAVADVVSTTGTEMSAVALPWLVLVTTGSPARTGLVLAAEFAGILLLGAWGGAVVHRLGPRATLLLADGVRAALVGSIPLLHVLGLLSLPLLLAAAFGIGSFFAAHQAARQLAVAGVVGDDELALTRTGGLLSAANESASAIGPAVGGLLVALLGAPLVLVVDAVSYLVALALVASALEGRGVEPVPARVLDGARWLRRDAELWSWTLGLAVLQIGFTAVVVAIPVLAREAGGASVAGLLLAAYGVGSVLGGLLSARSRRSGLSVPAAWFTALALLPLLGGPHLWVVASCLLAHGVGSGLVYPRYFAALTSRAPVHLRAHVITAATTGLSATAPVGFVVGGLLLERSGLQADLALAGLVVLVGPVLISRSSSPGRPRTDPAARA